MKYYFAVKPDKVAQAVALEAINLVDVVMDPNDADIIAAIGGDGSLLHTIYHLHQYGKPFVGINGGSEGAKCLIRRSRLEEGFSKIDSMVPFELSLLEAEFDGNIELAIQDIRLERRTGKTIRVRIEVDSEVIANRHAGDGILVSNALGSTGYNRSAGGEILPLSSSELCLTPVCPTYAMVAFDNLMKSIIVKSGEIRLTPEDRVCLVADNRDFFIDGGVTVRIRKSDKSFRLFLKEEE